MHWVNEWIRNEIKISSFYKIFIICLLFWRFQIGASCRPVFGPRPLCLTPLTEIVIRIYITAVDIHCLSLEQLQSESRIQKTAWVRWQITKSIPRCRHVFCHTGLICPHASSTLNVRHIFSQGEREWCSAFWFRVKLRATKCVIGTALH